jgi:hypothetical protein
MKTELTLELHRGAAWLISPSSAFSISLKFEQAHAYLHPFAREEMIGNHIDWFR